LLTALVAMSAQAHAGTCSDSLKQDIETQASTDFPGQSLNVQMPYIDESGGAVDKYDIPVSDQAGHVVTTYEILVNEACMIISLDRI
jgi:hypothetical protein